MNYRRVTISPEVEFSFSLHLHKQLFSIAAHKYSVTYSVLHQSFEEPFIPYADTFTWEGRVFEHRENQSEVRHTRRKRSDDHVMVNGAYASNRKEDTELGAIIIVDRISILTRYLKGPARRPFLRPRSLYVIAVLDSFEASFQRRTENVMLKLWRDYGIADAILITPCNGNMEVGVLI